MLRGRTSACAPLPVYTNRHTARKRCTVNSLAISFLLLIPIVALCVGRRWGWRAAAATGLLGGFVGMSHHFVAFELGPGAEVNKAVVGGVTAIVACLFGARSREWSLRKSLSWLDALFVAFLVMPLASAIANNLPIWDAGIAPTLYRSLTWGAAWMFGRTLVQRTHADQVFSIVLILGLAYIPICLYEMSVGPRYYIQHLLGGLSLEQIIHWSDRFGGWRPIGLLANGVRLGRWMTVATLVAAYLAFRPNTARSTRFVLAFVVLLLVTLACRSLSWLCFLVAGLALGAIWRWVSPRLALIGIAVLIGLAATYITTRMTTGWQGEQLLELAGNVSSAREQSLRFRLETETLYTQRTLEHGPWFGWGHTGDYFVYPRYIDQRWLAELTHHGVVAATLWAVVLTLPILLTLIRVRFRIPICSEHAWLVVPLVFTAFALVDGLFNRLQNPIFMISTAALVTFLRNRPSGELPRSDGCCS